MRLTCPSCGATYEVPDDVIPDDGRDVQCSNCGKTWFQAPDTENTPEALAAEAAAPKDAVWHPEVESDLTEGPSVNQGAAPGATPPPAPPRRRELEPEVAGILREEAEREARAREAEASGLENQPDLGLQAPEDEAEKRARQAQERMRRLRGDDTATASAAAASAGAVADRPQSRGEMLPDVDEINQTLRASSERREVQSAQAQLEEDEEKSGGFGKGFVFTILLFAIGAVLYVYAPQIVQQFPQSEPYMGQYVAFVDQGRVWLADQVAELIAMVSGGEET